MSTKETSTAVVWAPNQPSDKAPWNLRRVVHLHRRAGFAATWDEIQRDLTEGFEASIRRVLDGRMPRSEPPEGFEKTAEMLAQAAITRDRPLQLKAWWIYRLTHSPDPLGEQLTLMWHNHFATSNLKVDDPAAMHEQNETLRRLARAPFGETLHAMIRDRALLVWLDADANRKGRPNENLARELLELFTLGIGHYEESDVHEAARSLTGWMAADGGTTDPEQHHAGEKTIFGRTGNWDAADLIKILLEHPATASRLAWRICDHFMGEGVVGAKEVNALAIGLRQHDLDVGWAVATVLRSARFFNEANISSQVTRPIDFVVNTTRALELAEDDVSPAMLAEWSAELGQELFYPPNVGGWPGGRSWLSPRTMIARINFAAAVAEGRLAVPTRAPDVRILARSKGFVGLDETANLLSQLLWGRKLTSREQDRLFSNVRDGVSIGGASASTNGSGIERRLLAAVLSSPEAHLG